MKQLLIAVAILISTSMFSQISNESIQGKYEALTAESCELWSDGGGCMVNSYCILNFEKDAVLISTEERIYSATDGTKDGSEVSSAPAKRHKWRMDNGSISIENFDKYGALKLAEGNLVGKDNSDKALHFIKIPQ